MMGRVGRSGVTAIDPDSSPVENLRRGIGRASFAVAGAGLLAGVFLSLAGARLLSAAVLKTVFGLLLVLPVVNVLAVIGEEIRRRDWTFAAVAVFVLALLGWAIAGRLAGS
jgi:hypothetical protein